MARQIIKCPSCEEKGVKQSLAEVLDSGIISIQRIRTQVIPGTGMGKFTNHTFVEGKDILISCGNCGEAVFRRKL